MTLGEPGRVRKQTPHPKRQQDKQFKQIQHRTSSFKNTGSKWEGQSFAHLRAWPIRQGLWAEPSRNKEAGRHHSLFHLPAQRTATCSNHCPPDTPYLTCLYQPPLNPGLWHIYHSWSHSPLSLCYGPPSPRRPAQTLPTPYLHMCAFVGPQFGWKGQVSFHKNTIAPHVKLHPIPDGDKTLPPKTKRASVDN